MDRCTDEGVSDRLCQSQGLSHAYVGKIRDTHHGLSSEVWFLHAVWSNYGSFYLIIDTLIRVHIRSSILCQWTECDQIVWCGMVMTRLLTTKCLGSCCSTECQVGGLRRASELLGQEQSGVMVFASCRGGGVLGRKLGTGRSTAGGVWRIRCGNEPWKIRRAKLIQQDGAVGPRVEWSIDFPLGRRLLYSEDAKEMSKECESSVLVCRGEWLSRWSTN